MLSLLLHLTNIQNQYIKPHIYKIITILTIIGGYMIFKKNNNPINMHSNNHQDIINQVNNLFYKQEWNYKNINKKYIISNTFKMEIDKLKNIYYNEILYNNYNKIKLQNIFNDNIIYLINEEYNILENQFKQEQINIINEIPKGQDILKNNLQEQIKENKIFFTEILNIFKEIKNVLLIYIQ